jgi:hypothetical protein
MTVYEEDQQCLDKARIKRRGRKRQTDNKTMREENKTTTRRKERPNQ